MHVLFRGVELVDAFYMRLCTELSEPIFVAFVLTVLLKFVVYSFVQCK